MDLFRTPGIGPALPPASPPKATSFGHASSRRYGRYRPGRASAADRGARASEPVDGGVPRVDQDIEEYFFE